jgi:SAM-dependent methyltransferase
MSDLYKHPEEYDREHLGDDEDIGFYLSLTRRLAPRKVLELGCGTGRITLPLAQLGFDVVGLDNQPEMLQKAEERRRHAPSEIRQRLQFIAGDMRTWSAGSDFDLILIPASSITHVLSLEDQLAVWKTCHDNLRPGGRLLVEATMPNMASFADSFGVPPRTPVEIDIDNIDESDGTRLIRGKTTRSISATSNALRSGLCTRSINTDARSKVISTTLHATFSFPVNCTCSLVTPGTKSRKRSATIGEEHLWRILP